MGDWLKAVVQVSVFISFSAISAAAQEDPEPASGPARYLGSETCISCHEDQAEAWAGSHHALAWTPADSDHVLADFDGTEFSHDGVGYAFRIQDGGYFVSVTEPDGSARTHRIHSVAGVAPLQQFLIETRPGQLQSFDVVWDVEQGGWFHLYPDQHLPPGDGLHWSGPYKNWNARCAECHATGYDRNYGARTKIYRSELIETGVGCEGCHGPGSNHAALTRAGNEAGPGYGFKPGLLEPGLMMQQCASCHSRREALTGGTPLPGTEFHETYNLAWLRPGLYHPDGQILDEVYVWGSFLQSKMNAKGVTCLNCHEAHSAELKAEGNAVCAQCHSPAGNPDFPTLRKADYSSGQHSRHAEGSDGAQCVSCHMIERTYMGNDGRRDHSFRIPRPDLGALTGSPDACTDCHQGRSQDWAAGQIAKWFPDPSRRGAHYGTVFASARTAPQEVPDDLMAIAQDSSQPGLVRATALYLLRPAQTAALSDLAAELLQDGDPLVQAAAAGMQSGRPPAERAARLLPMLQTAPLMLRIAIARALLDVPPETLSPSQAAQLAAAMRDWQRSLSTRLDYPETHMVLGGMAMQMRNLPAAQAAFGQAVRLDPQRADAWQTLVRVTAAAEGQAAALRIARRGLQEIPQDQGLRQLEAELLP